MNTLFILSEHHNPFFMGCAGNDISHTPNIDRLADEGVMFEHTYCTSPHCVPARGGLFSGRHAFETGVWCNSTPWDGTSGGGSFHLQENGVEVTSIGKLDFKPDCDYGIDNVIQPKLRNSPDIHSLYREQEIVPRFKELEVIKGSRPRDDYPEVTNDTNTLAETVRWLKEDRPKDKDWLLNVNFMKVHPVWATPPEYWNKYNDLITFDALDEMYRDRSPHHHSYMEAASRYLCADYITEEDIRKAHVGFYASCEMLDNYIGTILEAIENEGLMDDTMIVYSADHGASLHAHRCWTLLNLWEGSVRVPLIVRHPKGKQGLVDQSPTHHHDVFATIADNCGLGAIPGTRGVSLLPAILGGDVTPRRDFTMSEIHNNGWPGSSFALYDGIWKYIYCAGEQPLLFNLETDPQEMHDMVLENRNDPAVVDVLERMHRYLLSVCDPEAVDKQCKYDQAVLRKNLDESGQLVQEITKRGYIADTSRLIPDPAILQQHNITYP